MLTPHADTNIAFISWSMRLSEGHDGEENGGIGEIRDIFESDQEISRSIRDEEPPQRDDLPEDEPEDE
ncbi:MAG: hypothetical protein OXG65_11010 [Chloroflexi bacterium]|nr:hypothetical protein [Chloroflexota bacterium]